MFEPLSIEPGLQHCYSDPRGGPDFKPRLFPGDSEDSTPCDGVLCSIKLKFRSAYYRRNYLNDLVSQPSPSDEEFQSLKAQLEEIHRAIIAIEDACTPFGFLAEPVYDDIASQVQRLRFTHPIPSEVKANSDSKVTSISSSSFSFYVSMDETEGDLEQAQEAQIPGSPSKRILLKASLSPGDILMLTAAVRDLHRCCPDTYEVDVRTPCDALWENNPYLTPLDELDPSVEVIDCQYPLVHESNQRPYHFIHGYIQFLSQTLDESITPTLFRGDIHVSENEASESFLSGDQNPDQLPVWIICAGGKYDFTIKWWHWRRYQEVVNRFRGKILFVQVGEEGHFHPKLDHVIDLRGKTKLRDMVHLMHWADGVLCGVTFHMHLAAAVPLRQNQFSRPTVVIAGGRESPHWEAYPTHQFLHTVGMLECCSNGGCWKSRTLPLGDGDVKDGKANLCLDVVEGLPRCMHMIEVDHVCAHLGMALDNAS